MNNSAKVLIIFLVLLFVISGCKKAEEILNNSSGTNGCISSEVCDLKTESDANSSFVENKNNGSNNKVTSSVNSKNTVKSFAPWESKTSYSDAEIKNVIAGKTKSIQIVTPASSANPDLVEGQVRQFLSTNSDGEAAAFWSSCGSPKLDYSVNPTVSWSSDFETRFKVAWSLNSDFSDSYYKTVDGYSTKLEYLIPGKKYYYVVISDTSISPVATIQPIDYPVRWVKVDGGSNFRDLGGWKTENGKKVKYGMLFRCACIDGYNGNNKLTSFGIKEVAELLHIKSEIDLRAANRDDGGRTLCVFGGKYYKNEITQYDRIFTSDTSKKTFAAIFAELSDESNYPVIFHCNAGADRTGTLAFILNGLLGVSYNDLTKDFELTTFSGRRRLRGELSNGQFVNGVFQNDNLNYIAWGDFYTSIMNNYGTGDSKLSSAIQNFLMTECYVPQEQIDTFISLMTE